MVGDAHAALNCMFGVVDVAEKKKEDIERGWLDPERVPKAFWRVCPNICFAIRCPYWSKCWKPSEAPKEEAEEKKEVEEHEGE